MTQDLMAGRRALVIGASSGIGASLARAMVETGASVAVSARRAERLDELCADMGAGIALPGDATNRNDMRGVAASGGAMGGLDLMVYVAGTGVLQSLVDTDPDTWHHVFAVNVIGANLAAAAALDHMGRNGVSAFVSSRTVEDANAHFATYSATKAALDQCIRIWRAEHRDRRFVRIVMGNTDGTEFAEHMGIEKLGDAMVDWQSQAIPGGTMGLDDVGRGLTESLAVVLDHPDIDASEIKFDARTA